MRNNIIITVKPEAELFNQTFEGTKYLVSEKDLSTGMAPFVNATNMKTGNKELLYIASSVKETFLLTSKLHVRTDRVTAIVCHLQPISEEQKAMITNKEIAPEEASRSYNLMTINPNADEWRKDAKYPFSTVATNTGEKLRPSILSGVFAVTKQKTNGRDLPINASNLTIDKQVGVIANLELQEIKTEGAGK